MSEPTDNIYRVSEALSEVLDDIGVNEGLVMQRRRTMLLVETIKCIIPGLGLLTYNYYNFGSQSEGSTTLGLQSDFDFLFSSKLVNVLQSRSERKPDMENVMMTQNENTFPGYCYLQYIGPDIPFPTSTNVIDNDILMHSVIDSEGSLLFKNTLMLSQIRRSLDTPIGSIHGPALSLHNHGIHLMDTVWCFYCESTPHQVTAWVQNQRGGKWPREHVLEACRNAGCFVVPVGSKVHSPNTLESELEWRISTSLQERQLMFSLNIPQLGCYILMKMILKAHINPHVEDVLTSFMCKNVLLYCVAKSSCDWQTGNLLSYLHKCLFMLKECIKQRNCPHFMIPENNLLAGHMTEGQRSKLLDIIDNLMENNEHLLFEIQIDALGQRLKMKLNKIPHSSYIQSATLISQQIHTQLVDHIAIILSIYLKLSLNVIKQGSLEMAKQYLSQTCLFLESHRNEGDLQQTASDLLIPLVSSTLGSVIACIDIDKQAAVSGEAFTYLEAGKESDALSGRLKLISVLFCSGDMERVVRELINIQTQNKISHVVTICSCCVLAREQQNILIKDTSEYNNEKAITSDLALCTRFLQVEANCVLPELRYEILKSYIEEDKKFRTQEDTEWMDLIVVDSIPYLFFLWYKTCSHLQINVQQERALHNLALSIVIEPNLRHKETALNLLGQCLEQENRQTEALKCYMRSLKHRKRNNAASFLMCMQLFKLWKKDNIQCK